MQKILILFVSLSSGAVAAECANNFEKYVQCANQLSLMDNGAQAQDSVFKGTSMGFTSHRIACSGRNENPFEGRKVMSEGRRRVYMISRTAVSDSDLQASIGGIYAFSLRKNKRGCFQVDKYSSHPKTPSAPINMRLMEVSCRSPDSTVDRRMVLPMQRYLAQVPQVPASWARVRVGRMANEGATVNKDSLNQIRLRDNSDLIGGSPTQFESGDGGDSDDVVKTQILQDLNFGLAQIAASMAAGFWTGSEERSKQLRELVRLCQPLSLLEESGSGLQDLLGITANHLLSLQIPPSSSSPVVAPASNSQRGVGGD